MRISTSNRGAGEASVPKARAKAGSINARGGSRKPHGRPGCFGRAVRIGTLCAWEQNCAGPAGCLWGVEGLTGRSIERCAPPPRQPSAATEHGRAGGRHAERSEASGFSAPIGQILRRCVPQNDGGGRYRRGAIHARKVRRSRDARLYGAVHRRGHPSCNDLRTVINMFFRYTIGFSTSVWHWPGGFFC